MKTFFKQKRNLAVVILLCVLLLAHVAGLVMSACLERAGTIDHAEWIHRLLYFFLGIVLMGGIFAVEAVFRFRFPLFFEIVIVVFAFASNSLATIYGFYDIVPHWDKVLHFVSGAIFASLGLCLAHFLFRDLQDGTKKTVAFVLFAFLVALAVGYLWELYEFLCDTVTGSNLQMWGTTLIEDLGNGTYLVSDKRGGAILDSMMDMLLNAACALLFCLIIFFAARKKPAVLQAFRCEKIPKKQSVS